MSKTVYVVYWVELCDSSDGYCSNDSEITILGVFDNEKAANELSEDYYHNGKRGIYYYTKVEKMEINVIPQDILEDLCDIIFDYNKCKVCGQIGKIHPENINCVEKSQINYLCDNCI